MSYSKTTWSTGDTITAAKMNKIEQGVYDAHNGSGSGGGITTETDPTVPSWAKQSSKPTYTASEVGALPSSTEIHNVPSGGTTGQVLTKRSNTNYDLQWSTPSSGSGSGGTNVLIATCAYNSNLGATALDKTVQEISNAITSGIPVYMKFRYGTDSSYVDDQVLAPIVYVFRYGDAPPEFRVVVARPFNWGSISSKSFVFTPGMLLFRASSANSYPVWYAEVHPASGAFVAG